MDVRSMGQSSTSHGHQGLAPCSAGPPTNPPRAGVGAAPAMHLSSIIGSGRGLGQSLDGRYGQAGEWGRGGPPGGIAEFSGGGTGYIREHGQQVAPGEFVHEVAHLLCPIRHRIHHHGYPSGHWVSLIHDFLCGITGPDSRGILRGPAV